MFPFGTIVLARFPFTDLSGAKRRPALVVSTDNDLRPDLIVSFITSRPGWSTGTAAIEASADTGLKVASFVRFDKIATLERSVISGRVGEANANWLAAQRATFFQVFGF